MSSGRWRFATDNEARAAVRSLPGGVWTWEAYGHEVTGAWRGGGHVVRVLRAHEPRVEGMTHAALLVGRYGWAYGVGRNPASALWAAVRAYPVVFEWEGEGPAGEGRAAMRRALLTDREELGWAVAARLRVEQGGSLTFRAGPVLDRLQVTSKGQRAARRLLADVQKGRSGSEGDRDGS